MRREYLTYHDMATIVQLLERNGEDRLADIFRDVMLDTWDGWAMLEAVAFGKEPPTPRPPEGGSAATSVDSLGV